MKNKELNQYIQHYIEKDKTGRAIMLRQHRTEKMVA